MFFESWESVLRTVASGAVTYVALVAMLRVSGKRTLSKMNAFDLVVTVAFGSILASTMLSKDVPLVDGLAALAVLILAQYAVAKGSVRWPSFATVVKSTPRLLMFRGAWLPEAMKAERVSEGEVRAALREHGVARLEDAGAVVLETDGTLTVVRSLPTGAPPTALSGVRGVPERT